MCVFFSTLSMAFVRRPVLGMTLSALPCFLLALFAPKPTLHSLLWFVVLTGFVSLPMLMIS